MQKVSLLAVAARYLQHRAEQQAIGAAPPAYQLMYDFWAGRSDWQQAAGAQLALARRLAAEAPLDEDTLGRIAVALGAPLTGAMLAVLCACSPVHVVCTFDVTFCVPGGVIEHLTCTPCML